MKEQLEQYVKLVKERFELCRGNEQQTKASLIAPLFVILGYDMADPRQCIPEYRADFGSGQRAATPVDWAFLINDTYAFFVEAKEAGAKLRKYAEQLGMYFGKGQPHVKLGIYTTGLQWQFYTDLDTANVMDKEPFLTWNVLDDEIPSDFLTILHKSQFNPQLVQTFARRKHHHNLLLAELNRLLEPSPEFIKLAVQNIETRHLHPKIVEEWRPILANAIQEWAKQQTLTMVLKPPEEPPPPEIGRGGKPSRGGVTLADLIAAGILTPPLKLLRKYKGQLIEADLLPDGKVMFQGVAYASCSKAGIAAVRYITGRRIITNGWTFWHYRDATGQRFSLDDARMKVPQTEKGHRGPPGKKDRPARYDLRKTFWEGLLNRPKVKTTRHANIAPAECGWISAGSGVRGLPFVYVIGKDEGKVELYIDRGAGKTEANKRIFDQLHSQKKEIEGTFGGELSWQRLNDKQACRIAYITPVGGYRSDESKWPEIQDAMIDAMTRLEKALTPHLAKLKTELASEGA
jgi:predicted type IV restriction endonuclease